jgi:hypothetical protein
MAEPFAHGHRYWQADCKTSQLLKAMPAFIPHTAWISIRTAKLMGEELGYIHNVHQVIQERRICTAAAAAVNLDRAFAHLWQ